jgi:leucyl-tRNA synthetase
VADDDSRPIQVDIKVRARLEVPVDIAEDDLCDMALSAPDVTRALAGRAVRRTAARPSRLVVVTA